MSLVFPAEWGLSGAETILLRMLLRRQQVSVLTYTCAMGWMPDWDPSAKILAVPIHKLRKKLGPAGVSIETVRGQGYRLSGKSKAKVKALCVASGTGQAA